MNINIRYQNIDDHFFEEACMYSLFKHLNIQMVMKDRSISILLTVKGYKSNEGDKVRISALLLESGLDLGAYVSW